MCADWYYAVGSSQEHQGGIPGPDGGVVQQTELWALWGELEPPAPPPPPPPGTLTVRPDTVAIQYTGRTRLLPTGQRKFDWSGVTVSLTVTSGCACGLSARLIESTQRNRYKVFVTMEGGERQALSVVTTSLIDPLTTLLEPGQLPAGTATIELMKISEAMCT